MTDVAWCRGTRTWEENERKVTFHLYCKASEASIILETKDSLIPMERSIGVNDHHTVSVNIPKNMNIRYGYEVHLHANTDSFGSLKPNAHKDEKHFPRQLDSKEDAVWDFLDSDGSLSVHAEGLKTHFIDIIIRTKMINLKTNLQHLVAITQRKPKVDYLMRANALKTTATELFKLDYTRSQHCLSLLVLMTSWEIYSIKSLNLKDIIQQPHAEIILQSCKEETKDIVRKTVHGDISTVLVYLTKIAFDRSACLLLLMKYAYPFLDESDFCKLERFGGRFSVYEKDVLEYDSILQIVNLVCERIITQQKNQNGEYIAQKILKSLPFNVAQQCAADTLHSLKSKTDLDLKRVESLAKTILQIVVTAGNERIEKTSSFTDLYDIVKGFLPTFKAELSLIAIKHIGSLCLNVNETEEISSQDISSLERMIHVVEVPIEKEKELLQKIADSKNDFSALLIQLLDLSSVKYDTNFCHSLLVNWMDRRTRNAKGTSETIVKNYHFLVEVLQVPFVKDNTDYTKKFRDSMLKLVKKMNSDTIIELLTKTKWQDGNAENLFVNHIQESIKMSGGMRFFKKSNILGTLYDGQPVVLGSQERATLTVTLMEHVSTVETSLDVIDTILQIMEQKKFWKSILTGKGKYFKTLSSSKTYSHVKRCLEGLPHTIHTKMFKYSSITKLNDIRKCGECMSLLGLFGNQNALCQSILDSFEKAQEVDKELSKIKSFLHRFCASPVSGVLRGKRFHYLNATRLHFQIQHKNLREGKIQVSGVLMCKTWCLVKKMTCSLERLRIVQDSEVFCRIFIERDNKTKVATKTLQRHLGIAKDRSVLSPKYVQRESTKKTEQRIKSAQAAVHSQIEYSDFDTLQCVTFVHKFLTELQGNILYSYTQLWDSLISRGRVTVYEVQNMFANCNIDKEISIIKKSSTEKFTETIEADLKAFLKVREYKDVVTAVIKTLGVFGIDAVETKHLHQSLAICEVADTELDKNQSFWVISRDVRDVYDVASNISSDMLAILHLIGTSSTLVDFLKRVADEDLRNLIDAVEQYTETLMHVQESTVSSLIEVKRFLYPLLLIQTHEGVTVQHFIDMLKQQMGLGIPFIHRKLYECNANIHSLMELYKSKANRGQQTIEIVQNIIEDGTFTFYIRNQNVTFKVHTLVQLCGGQVSEDTSDRPQHDAKEVIYYENKLRDLLSRSHLLINAKHIGGTYGEEDSFKVKKLSLEEFICCIRKVLDLSNVYTELRSLGHYCYIALKESVKVCDVADLLQKETLELEEWNSNLIAIQEAHYYMNYVHPNYIPTLFQFVISKGKEGRNDVLSLLRYIIPNVILPDNFDIPFVDHTEATLQSVANMLDQTLNALSIEPVQTRQIATQRQQFPYTSVVQKGFFYITQMSEKSAKSSIQAMLSLYLANGGNLPEANQIVLCTKDTDWIEISLLLKRCSRSLKSTSKQNLFCIVNTDELPIHVQKRLSMEIKSIESNTGYMLASVFRGGDNEAFLHQFVDHIRFIEPFSDYETHKCFISAWPNVTIVKSSSSGLGKTTFIKREFENILQNKPAMRLVTLHISSVLNKDSLIQVLKELKITEQTVLHIDVGMIDKPNELDVFLFQLIALRHVSHEKKSYYLQTSIVFVEIANTVNNTLDNSMPIIALFNTKELSWNDYTDFRISDQLTCSVQNVCSYLNSLKMKTIDSKELSFADGQDESINPLSEDECRNLLRHYFPTTGIDDMSFSITEIFLAIFSEQLRRMTTSNFFKLNTLRYLPRQPVQYIRSSMVEVLLDVSRNFALTSVSGYKTIQAVTQRRLSQLKEKGTISDDDDEVDSVEAVHWEHSHQTVVAFHQDEHTISVLYKTLEKEPSNIRRIRAFVEAQDKHAVKSLESRSQVELQNLLLRMLSRKESTPQNDEYELRMRSYALTPDNILKFMLISLRIQSKIPVVLIGETGCGKTSLIRNLAFLGKVTIEVFNIHAGITELDILNRVNNCHERALENIQEELWLFFDEINTSEQVGLLASIICKHECQRRPLASNLIFIAACNPYKFRKKEIPMVSGLIDGDNAYIDSQSHLVYRVHPLPSSLVNYVWDFGALNEKDEVIYIQRMLQGCKNVIKFKSLLDAFTEMITVSQTFVRKNENTQYSVSLRDVDRCKELAVWFLEYYMQKKDKVTDFKEEQVCKAIVLSLSICYFVRFTSKEKRHEYLEKIATVFTNKAPVKYTADEITEIVQGEQKDILKRMELPPGTAKNTSLRENIFVMLVCALNRLPLFVVGKPGCSKSLALQLLRNNLRGLDSSDSFFKRLPYLFYVSYQGSEQSTSEGIIKVFETARAYQNANKNYQSTDIVEFENDDTETIHQQKIIALVVLDEVGLAEKSGANPLKVLHSLLEMSSHGRSDVSFIGLSNWRLDPAKMNRAIHLSRPDMDFDDLYDTGCALHESITSFQWESEPPHLKKIAKAYDEYKQKQPKMNFHGLRDYYSLIKCVSGEISPDQRLEMQQDIVKSGILRNFSGLGKVIQNAYTIFQHHLQIDQFVDHDTMALIRENVKDELCRHLLLVSYSDSVVDSLQRLLKNMDREYVSMIGSCFPEDNSEDYGYRVLSDIILYMEQGQVLILKNLEKIYGSLYDMLNQNYTTVGKKKHCRIALGPHSNPMCYVNDAFKCIVIIDEEQIANSDPPFLNRFEKQIFEIEDSLTEFQKEILITLHGDVNEMRVTSLTTEALEPYKISPLFDEQNLKSTLASIILKISRDTDFTEVHEPVRRKCLEFLLPAMNPEHILNLHYTTFWKNNYRLGSTLQQMYMEQLHHNGLQSFLNEEVLAKNNDATYTSVNCSCVYTVITYSNPLVQIQNNLQNINFQIETLSTFSSEKHFQETMKHFWIDSESEVLLVRVLTSDDFDNFLLSKIITETWRNRYLDTHPSQSKHAVFIIYLRGQDHSDFKSNMDFLSDCRKIILLDTLLSPVQAWPQIVDKNVLQVLTERRSWLEETIKTHLPWAFYRIHYLSGSCTNRMETIVNVIKKSSDIRHAFVDIIMSFLEDEDDDENEESWIAKIAKNYEAVLSSNTFTETIESFFLEKIRQPLARLIYHLERLGAFHGFQTLETDNDEHKLKIWLSLLKKDAFHDISQIPKPTGPGCYHLSGSDVESKLPFSKFFFDRIESLKSLYFGSIRSSDTDSDDEDTLTNDETSESRFGVYQRITFQISLQIKDLTALSYNGIKDDYMHDFCNYAFTSTLKDMENKANILQWTMKQFVSCHGDIMEKRLPQFVADLHMCYWENFSKMDAFFKLFEMSKTFLHDSVYKVWLPIVTDSDKGESGATDNAREISHFVQELSKELIHKKPSSESNEENWFVWFQKSNAVLTLADNVDENSRETGYLKFYVEIGCVLNSYGLPCGQMCLLDDECIENQTVYERLTLLLKQFCFDPKRNLPKIISNKVVAIYLNRCFALNRESTKSLCQLLKDLQNENIFDMQCSYIGTTLKFYLLEENARKNSYLKKVLFAQTEEEFHMIEENFGDVEKELNNLLSNICCGRSLNVLLVNIFETHIFSFVDEAGISDLLGNKSEMLKMATNALKIVARSNMPMLRLVGISFLKRYLSRVAHCITKQTHTKSMTDNLNAVLNYEESNVSERYWHLYFLKCIENCEGLIYLKQRCSSLSGIEAYELFNQEHIALEKTFELESISIVGKSVWEKNMQMIEKFEQDIQVMHILHSPEKDVKSFVLCFFRSNIFLKHYRHEDVSERDRKIANKVKDDTSLYWKLLNLLSLRTKTEVLFRRTRDTDNMMFQILATLSHFICVVCSSSAEDGFWLKCLQCPKKVQQAFNLSEITSEDHGAFKPVSCHCKNRIATDKKYCPISSCKQIIIEDDNVKSVQYDSDVAFFCRSGDVSPLTYNILQFFAKGCLVFSKALEFIDNDTLKDLLNCHETHNIEEYLQTKVLYHWQNLRLLLNFGNGEVHKILKIAMTRIPNLMEGHLLQPLTVDTYEKNINQQVHDLLRERENIILQEEMSHNKKFEFEQESYWFQLTKEIEHSDDISYLLCKRSCPSIENMYAELLLSGEEYAFLKLALERHDQLKLPQYIPAIIKWHSFLVETSSYHLDKSECELSLGFLRHRFLSKDMKKAFDDKFEEFSKVWDLLKSSIQEVTFMKAPKLESLDMDSKINHCLLLNSDSLMYKVIDMLVRIQNNFLDEVLIMVAMSSSRSVSFLNKDIDAVCAAIPITPLMEATSTNVLNIMDDESDNTFLENIMSRFSECSTDEGKGRTIIYNFQKIEFEVAHHLLPGRTYISLYQRIPQIQFRDDVFQNTVGLIADIKYHIRQEDLPRDLTKSFKTKAKYLSLNEMLIVTGSVIAHLALTGGEPDTPYVKYLEKHKNTLPQSSEKEYLSLGNKQICIKHAVSFYRLVEELHGEKVLVDLPQTFEKGLPDCADELISNMSEKKGAQFLEDLLIAVKTF